jgi:YVTN family beta-propeller protein
MKPRLFAPVLLMLLLSADAASAQILLVLNKEEATLAFVEPASGKVTARVATGDGPHEVAVSADGRFAFVTNYGAQTAGNTLSVIDVAARREIRRVNLGALRQPHGITVSGGKVYFTAEAARVVARFDPDSSQIDWRFETGQDVTHMVIASRDGRRLYTSNLGSDTISVIEQGGTAGAWTQTLVRVGAGPEGLDLSPDGRELWTAHTGDGRVSIIDVSSKKVVQTIDAHTRRSNRLKFTPDGRLVLISDLDGGELIAIDARTRKETKRLRLGRMPEGILIEPDGSRAYVAVTGDDRVAVIDLKTLTELRTIATGNGPDGMAWVAGLR